jgi:hypothetical protein
MPDFQFKGSKDVNWQSHFLSGTSAPWYFLRIARMTCQFPCTQRNPVACGYMAKFHVWSFYTQIFVEGFRDCQFCGLRGLLVVGNVTCDHVIRSSRQHCCLPRPSAIAMYAFNGVHTPQRLKLFTLWSCKVHQKRSGHTAHRMECARSGTFCR